MVYGIERFKEYFCDYTEQYILIGGTACAILLDEIGVPFRATKDLDVVLLIEALNESFGYKFWEFIEAGGYEHRGKSTGKEQFYRFTNPSEAGFPAMIELFSRRPDKIKLHFNSLLTPIHIAEEITSLSAILLNDAYYNLLLEGRSIVSGYSVLGMEYIVLFKIKAWLDLSERVRDGEPIDSKTVKKHKNDVFRLLRNVSPGIRIPVEKAVREDVKSFLVKVIEDPPDLKNIGFRKMTLEAMCLQIRELYGITVKT